MAIIVSSSRTKRGEQVPPFLVLLLRAVVWQTVESREPFYLLLIGNRSDGGAGPGIKRSKGSKGRRRAAHTQSLLLNL